jgi:hypothetical protein
MPRDPPRRAGDLPRRLAVVAGSRRSTRARALPEKGENALRFYLAHPHARESLAFEVDPVIERFDDPDFITAESTLAEMRDSCEELEATGAWRDNARFREMLVEFYRNLARHAERRAIRRALERTLKRVTVPWRSTPCAPCSSVGSVANRYPEELVRVVI